ncbi:fatty acid desaturase, partial [Gammaproteobacteria bacterium]|nr:fatty acid desaturase [Gammaproteobacteria bacterium]
MSVILANIKYLLAPVLILVTFAGVLAGGLFAWLGVALLFVGIIIDTLMKKQASSEMHSEEGKTLANPTFQNLVMYSMLPVFVLLQFALAWRVYGFMSDIPVEVTSLWLGLIPYTSGISGLDLIGATLSTGIFAGIGIIYGHELSHCKGFAFIISR